MQEIKTILSITAIFVMFICYIPYFRDTIKGKTKPHVYTWLIWSFTTSILFALQVSGGAGVGSWVTLAAAIICIAISILGLKNGKKNITPLDTLFLVLSVLALFLWIVVKQPILSTILILSVDVIGFAPTVRKSWNKPYSETLFTYELGILRHGLSFLSLQQYNFLTWSNPVTWLLINILFSLMMLIRRKQIDKRS